MTAVDTGRPPAPGPATVSPAGAPDPGHPRPSRRPGRWRRRRGAHSHLLWAFAATAGLAAWFVLYAFVLSGLQEHAAQSRLYGRLRSELAATTAPLGGLIRPGSPVALISAPRGGIRDVVVVEGTTGSQLANGPGHLSDTPLPGQAGVSVLFGRSVTFGAPFRHLEAMRSGDPITVITGQGTYTYRVAELRRPGSPLPALVPAGRSRLTLVTSEGSGWRNGWAPQRAVYLDAILSRGTVQPAPAGMPAVVSSSSLPMHGDTSVLVALVLWLQVLVLLAGILTYCWVRWGRWQTWVAGWPILLAGLWGATAAALLLVPNLY